MDTALFVLSVVDGASHESTSAPSARQTLTRPLASPVATTPSSRAVITVTRDSCGPNVVLFIDDEDVFTVDRRRGLVGVFIGSARFVARAARSTSLARSSFRIDARQSYLAAHANKSLRSTMSYAASRAAHNASYAREHPLLRSGCARTRRFRNALRTSSRVTSALDAAPSTSRPRISKQDDDDDGSDGSGGPAVVAIDGANERRAVLKEKETHVVSEFRGERKEMPQEQVLFHSLLNGFVRMNGRQASIVNSRRISDRTGASSVRGAP